MGKNECFKSPEDLKEVIDDNIDTCAKNLSSLWILHYYPLDVTTKKEFERLEWLC